MPPRVVIAGIVAFWLATTGYVAKRDVWPRLFAHEPPPVSIELADEAKQNVPAKWALVRNGQKVGRLTTMMKYHDADNTFQFTYRYSQLKLEQAGIALLVPDAVADVRMTRDGDLKEQTMTGKIAVLVGKSEFVGTIDVRGAVADGALTGRGELKSSILNLSGDFEPVPVPKGQPLNPLQPVNRISNVRGGQEWVVHEYNPLQDALADLVRKEIEKRSGISLGTAKQKESLVATVGAAQQTLKWQLEEVPCWVIEYRRKDDPIARTWVRASDGKVLRQEAFEGGESVVFERED